VRVIRLEMFHGKSFRNDYNEAPSEDCFQKSARLRSEMPALNPSLLFAKVQGKRLKAQTTSDRRSQPYANRSGKRNAISFRLQINMNLNNAQPSITPRSA
jgi:hypothetical protein